MISGLSGLQQTPISRPEAQGLGDMDGEAFLRMMLANLQNQDPMNPMNAEEFGVQLAQFSQVEAMLEMRKDLQALQLTQEEIIAVAEIQLANQMVGRSLLEPGNGVLFGADGTGKITFDLDGSTQGITLTLFDGSGNAVGTQGLGSAVAGRNSVELSLGGFVDADGEPLDLQPGRYSYGLSVEGSANAVSYTRLAIDAVRIGENGIEILVGGSFRPFNLDLPVIA